MLEDRAYIAVIVSKESRVAFSSSVVSSGIRVAVCNLDMSEWNGYVTVVRGHAWVEGEWLEVQGYAQAGGYQGL